MTVRLQQAPFDAGQEMMALTSARTDVGACVTFLGQMRDHNQGRAVTSLELEHYPSLAQSQLTRIEAEARERWPLQDVLIIHRFGRISPGEPIVLVVVLAESRAEAFDSASFIMDYLKSEAPFWKSETRTDGQSHWVTSRPSDEEALNRWQDHGREGKTSGT